jgi:AcrR family transcriptional regulator
MNTSQTAPRTRSPKTHQAILDAAASILMIDGYAGLTIERIAKISGVGKPTIYRWWPNKTAILIDLFNRETSYLQNIEDIGSTHKEVLVWFDRVWQSWKSPVNAEAFRSIIAESQADPRALKLFVENYVQPRRESLLGILRRAQQRGELQGRDLEAIVDYCGGFNWHHLLMHTRPTKKTIETVVDTIV